MDILVTGSGSASADICRGSLRSVRYSWIAQVKGVAHTGKVRRLNLIHDMVMCHSGSKLCSKATASADRMHEVFGNQVVNCLMA